MRHSAKNQKDSTIENFTKNRQSYPKINTFNMPTARQVPPDLKKYMAKRVSVKMNGNRLVQGRLSGFDLFMNLVLEEAEEIVSGSTERLEVGVMIVRGNSVLQMECLDPV